tara:strand:+ start:1243 stop:1974 length:732 start_codon:yes stop_codon:yes gene_type:complete
MKLGSLNLKLVLGITYLTLLLIGLYFLFSSFDIKELTSYEFIRSNKDIILKYKNENFLFLATSFFIFSILWVLFLGFASPLLLFAGFVFGKWWGILIALISTTIGASLLYLLAGLFLESFIKEKLAPKFSKLKELFNKNNTLYFTIYRFIGGGGTPFAIQNILPVLFNMPIKNYIIATFIGSAPAMFVTVALGAGIESIIDKNETLTFFKVINSPEIYLPIFGFFIVLIITLFIKKLYFKEKI